MVISYDWTLSNHGLFETVEILDMILLYHNKDLLDFSLIFFSPQKKLLTREALISIAQRNTSLNWRHLMLTGLVIPNIPTFITFDV